MPKNFEVPDNLLTTTRAQWRKMVEKNLNGKSIEDALGVKTADGITIQPLYTKEDAPTQKFHIPRNNNKDASVVASVQILQHINIPDLKVANQQIKTDIEGGAGGFVLAQSNDLPYGADGDGGALPLNTPGDYNFLFHNIDLNTTTLYFSNGHNSLENTANFLKYCETSTLDAAHHKGSLGLDPLALFASNIIKPGNENNPISDWTEMVARKRSVNCGLTAFLVSGRHWQQKGASPAGELALTLASLLFYARALEAKGLSPQQAFGEVDITLSIGSDIFQETAKLRAMRLLLQAVHHAAGVNSVETKIIGEMSWLHMTKPDPEVNMLRAVAATVAASFGMVDGLVLLPFSATHGIADKSARRLALNTQIIAQEESHIGTVTDPAAGSWYVETLTRQIAEKAWELFQKIEDGGNIIDYLQSGELNAMLKANHDLEARAINTGHTKITGTTSFPNLDEKSPKTLKSQQSENTIRLTADIEALRKQSDAVLKQHGQRPLVFLANLGKPSDYSARATWAKSFFETGGIAAPDNNGFANPEDLATAFKTSNATIACLCTSDELLEKDAIASAKTLRAAGATAIFMVAKPRLLKTFSEEEQNSIDEILYQSADMVVILNKAHEIISSSLGSTS